MDEKPIDTLRASARTFLELNRRTIRGEESDCRRSLGKPSATSDSVVEIANHLKNKTAVSLSELQILKNALFTDTNNIANVLNINGALKGLARELSGNDVRRQCAAAGCCCNLALGDSRACTAVAKAVGPYLVTVLNNLSIELAVTSAWTLGNLAGSGAKVCKLLTSQGALAKLIELLQAAHEELRDASLYALVHFAYQMKEELRPEYSTKILQGILQMDANPTSRHLLFLISCHHSFSSSTISTQLNSILNCFLLTIKSHMDQCKHKCTCNLIYLIRFIANLNDFYADILQFCMLNDLNETFRLLFGMNDVVLNESMLWLLGNMFQSDKSSHFFQLL